MRACVELTLQVYNSKLALPNTAVRQFAHTDGDWLAEGFGKIPAPQCAALTSPSHVGGERHYRFRFSTCLRTRCAALSARTRARASACK